MYHLIFLMKKKNNLMKKLIIVATLFVCIFTIAQGVGIHNSTPKSTLHINQGPLIIKKIDTINLTSTNIITNSSISGLTTSNIAAGITITGDTKYKLPYKQFFVDDYNYLTIGTIFENRSEKIYDTKMCGIGFIIPRNKSYHKLEDYKNASFGHFTIIDSHGYGDNLIRRRFSVFLKTGTFNGSEYNKNIDSIKLVTGTIRVHKLDKVEDNLPSYRVLVTNEVKLDPYASGNLEYLNVYPITNKRWIHYLLTKKDRDPDRVQNYNTMIDATKYDVMVVNIRFKGTNISNTNNNYAFAKFDHSVFVEGGTYRLAMDYATGTETFDNAGTWDFVLAILPKGYKKEVFQEINTTDQAATAP